jgi:uncharacterized protein (TIGR03067 family)
MKLHGLLVVAAGLLAAAPAPDRDAAAKEELKKLEGAWAAVSATVDGKEVPADELKKIQVVVKGDTYSVLAEGAEAAGGTLSIDPTKSPKTIDATTTKGPNKGKSELGIYELDGDTLKMCFGPVGKGQRPKEFASKQGSGAELSVYKRVKR